MVRQWTIKLLLFESIIVHAIFHRTRIGNTRTVFLSDYQTIKETLASVDFADRPFIFSLFNNNPNERGGN